jgi:hypothetical protein
VILDPEDAVRFEHTEARPEPCVERPPVLHHVELTHHEDHIDGAVECFIRNCSCRVNVVLGRHRIDAIIRHHGRRQHVGNRGAKAIRV